MKNLFSKLILAILLLFIGNASYAYSPKIIAHRGGSKEFPENTLIAFEKALEAGVDGIELDVQLSKDEIVMLYHPRDLSLSTEANGSIGDFNLAALKELDAAYNFDPQGNKSFPKRGQGYQIATLVEVLDKFPQQEIIVDLKSLPANKLINAIIKLVDEKQAWGRLVFYSTNEEHLEYFKQHKPEARLFENRLKTRQRLLTMRNEHVCCCKADSNYIGFELSREMVVEEAFALGKSTNKIHFKLWDNDAVECVKNSTNKSSKIFLFGINSKLAYEEAKKLKAYAIFTDEPAYLIKVIKP